MKTVIALVVLSALALVGSRWAFVARKLPPGLLVFFTGTELILAGLLLGDGFLGLVDRSTLANLAPFVCVVLGWVGFLFGLQLERSALRKLPAGVFRITLIQAFSTFAVVLPFLWAVFSRHTHLPWRPTALAVVTLAASAACTGQTALALLVPRPEARARITLLKYVSSLDPVVGLVIFGVALSILGAHPGATGQALDAARWLALSVLLALCTAWIFVSLTSTRTTQSELVLYLLGILALCSGIALGFQLSPLFVSFVCGITVANLARIGTVRGRLVEVLVGSEKLLYSALLIVVGASLDIPMPWVVVAALLYAVLRLGGKALGGYLAIRRNAQGMNGGLLGFGLASQAGMGLAIVVDYRLVGEAVLADLVLGLAVVAIVVNELAAPALAGLALRRRQEGGT